MHNFIIHSLVNEVDLNILGNTLNNVSRSTIPFQSPGSAIFVGPRFPLSAMVHIYQLDKRHAPGNDNADFKNLVTT